MKTKNKVSRYKVILCKDTVNPDISKFRILEFNKFIGWLRLDGSIWNTSNNKELELSDKEVFQIRKAAIYSQNTRTILHYWVNNGL